MEAHGDLGVLLLISRPGGPLSYDDHDIVVCQQAAVSPGTRVSANAADQWSFLYITDATCAEVAHLTEDLRSYDVPPEDEYGIGTPGQAARRRYCCVLTGKALVTCGTYRTLADAPSSQKVTFKEFTTSYLHDKETS